MCFEYYWDDDVVQAICRSMGFDGVLRIKAVNSKRIILDDVHCDGDEEHIFDCNHVPLFRHNCDRSEDAGVVCDPGSEMTEPPIEDDSTIRLADGTEFWEGRVEIFYDGSWNTVCDDYWDITDARVVCRMLGYNDSLYALGEAHFPDLTPNIHENNLDCAGTDEGIIENCSFRGEISFCNFYLHVTCIPPNIRGGDIRLIGATSKWEGDVRVLGDEDTWYAVCDDGWDMAAGEVVCRMLGYEGVALTAIAQGSNGSKAVPFILDDIGCDGSETNILDCSHAPLYEHDCTQQEIARVSCQPDFRLVGGELSSTGIIEVFHNNTWETLCISSDDRDLAYVVCNQLGYKSFVITKIDLDKKDPEHDFSRLRFLCDREESECFVYLGPDTEKSRTCSDAEEVVGVACSPPDPCESQGCPDDISLCVAAPYVCETLCYDVPPAHCLYEECEDHCTSNRIPTISRRDYTSYSYSYSFSSIFLYGYSSFSPSDSDQSTMSDSQLSTPPDNQSDSSSTIDPASYFFPDYRYSRMIGILSFTSDNISAKSYNLFLPKAREFVLNINDSDYDPLSVRVLVRGGYDYAFAYIVFLSHSSTLTPRYLRVEDFSVWIEITSLQPDSTLAITYVADCTEDGHYALDGCSFPLGLEANWIQKGQITGSSRIDGNHAYRHARLHGPSSWMPHYSDTDPFLDIAFNEDYNLRGLVIQGGGGNDRYWVKSFSLQYQLHNQFVYVISPHKPTTNWTNFEIFEGNSDYYCTKFIGLPSGIITDRIRIRPIQETRIALRMEVLGCRPNGCKDTPTPTDIRNVEYQIRYHLRLSPGDTSFESGNESTRYWSEHYGTYPRTISRILSRKCLLRDGLSEFELRYRNSSVEDSNSTTFEVISKLNFDYHDTVWAQIEFDPPIENVYELRIYPRMWTTDDPCLQIQVFGCLSNTMCTLGRLGMESMDIPDENIMCNGCDEDTLSMVRLNSYGDNLAIGCLFQPITGGTTESAWLQVQFPKRVYLRGVILQSGTSGYQLDDDFDPEKLTYQVLIQYRPTTALSETNFLPLGRYYFIGRPFAQETILFNDKFLTTAVRITPITDTYRQTARFAVEFIGCRTDATCFADNSYFGGECFNFYPASLYHPDLCRGSPDFGSTLGYIKSQGEQTFVKELASSSLPPNIYVRMGMEYEYPTLRWLDGSVVHFEAFAEPILPEADLNGTCGFMDPANCYQWQMRNCTLYAAQYYLCEADFNECLDQSTHNCSETCVNIPNTYYCKCSHGMIMNTHTECIHMCDAINSLRVSYDYGPLMDYPVCVYTSTGSWDYMKSECYKQRLGRIATQKELFAYSDLSDGEYWWTIEEGRRPRDTCTFFSLLSNETTSGDCTQDFNFLCITEYQYIQLEDEDMMSFNTNLTSPLGYLGFSAHLYTAAYDKCFYVQVNESLSLRLMFKFVSLREQSDGSGNCLDYVSVEDLVQEDAEPRKICGEYREIKFIVSHYIRIHVFAESISSLIQFSMTYEAIDCEANRPDQIDCETGCGTTELVYDGDKLWTYPFPSEFIPFSACETNVTVPSQSFIRIDIEKYLFVAGSDGACQDGVSLILPSITLTFSCDVSRVPHLIVTNSNSMTVGIVTGRQSSSKGFMANVTASDIAGCAVGTDLGSSRHLCTSSPGLIASKFYPNYIALGTLETWLLQAPPSGFVELLFEVLRLSGEGDCSSSRIDVIDYNTGNTIESFCSGVNTNRDGMEVRTDVNAVKVEVKVNLYSETVKFLATYRFLTVEQDNENWEPPDPFQNASCPENWVLYRGNCYMYAQINDSSWALAEEYCSNQPGEMANMVSILDKREARFIHGQLITQWSRLGQSIYIGLGDRNSASMFRWTNGSPMTYTDWFVPRSYEEENMHRQPDGASIEKCSIITLSRVRFSSLWHDIPCASVYADSVICKMAARTLISRKRRDTTEFNESVSLVASHCSYNTRECQSGECVQRVYEHDGVSDCFNGSDEGVTPETGNCRQHQFQCLFGGQCISISFVCDHKRDCDDGSDEFDCIFPSECRDGEYYCSNSQKCISGEKKCNLIEDCPTPQGGDEHNCPEEYIEKKHFQCFSGTWLPSKARCDGLVDCIGNGFEDEKGCDSAPCDGGFSCSSGVCIENSQRCIFDLDQLGYVKGCRDVSHLSEDICADFKCPAYHYKCPSSYCIPMRLQCDSIKHCLYGEDENECEVVTKACPSRSYTCRSSKLCVAPSELCDGIEHCPNGDDELFCDVECPNECECTGLTMNCTFESTNGHVVFPHDTRKIIIKLNSDYQLEIKRSTNEKGDTTIKTVSFWPSDYMSLVELHISQTNLKDIPATAFLKTRNLRTLNVSRNTELSITPEVLYNLTRLYVFDIFGISIKSSDEELATAFKTLVNLKTLQTDEFGFCCLSPTTTNCIGYTNQFSSCDDLLKDVSLRAFMWILGLSALVGNALALASRFARRKQAGQNRIQVMFITHLAVSDLLMGLYMIVIAGADSHYRGRYALHAALWTSSITCKMAGFLSVLSSEVSVLLVMLISIDRFLSVVFPLKNEVHLTVRLGYILVCASWVFSVLLSIIPALPLDYFGEFYGKSSVCLALPLTSDRLPGWEYSIVVFICTNFICFMLTFLCYFVIYISVRKSHMRIKGLGAASNSMMKEQMQMTTKMALVVGTDFICWMPIIIMGILASSNLVQIPADIYAWTAVFILPLNSALNPYLYTLSTVLQRWRKARESTDSMSLTQNTRYSVEQTQREKRLIDYCIIPHTTLKLHKRIEPITTYLMRRGGTLNDRQEMLMVRDLRRALCHLKSLGANDRELIASNVAVEMDRNETLIKAFFVMTNPIDISRFVGTSGSDSIQTKLSSLFDQIQDPMQTPV